MRSKIIFLWSLFFLIVFAASVKIILHFLGLALPVNSSDYLLLSLPFLIIFLHAIWTLSFRRGIAFLLLACLTGFTFEFFGLKYGAFFGGRYLYSPHSLKILTVPLSVILYWGVFIYTGYCLTNSFLFWQNKEKPSRHQKNPFSLLPLILLDVFIVVAIDLFMDPLQVKSGSWTWLSPGPYFGIPLGNFLGWGAVTAIVTGLFRTFEYFKPSPFPPRLKKTFLLAVFGYTLLCLNFLFSAIKFRFFLLALIGSLAMFPPVTLSLYFFKKYFLQND